MHKLLERQLRRHFGDITAVPSDLEPFLASVDDAYRQTDDDRRLLEHSMDTVSLELADRYRRLNDALAQSQNAQQELTTTLDLLESIIESTTDGLLVVDTRGKMLRMNTRFIEMWGIPGDIVESGDEARALRFVASQLEEPDTFLSKIAELYRDPEAESFDSLRFKDGRVYERYSMPKRGPGSTLGRVWSFRDVTARKRLEDQLRQSQKMEAIGSLAGGVAHDFNNLLTVITGHLDLVVDDEALDPSHRADIAITIEAADRAALLTRQLLAFGRRQVLNPQTISLNEVVDGLQPMLARVIEADIEVELDLTPDLYPVVADHSQLERVLLNLSVNARDAMPHGGRLTISTSNLEAGEDDPLVTAGALPAGRYVQLGVRDTGSGIPPDLTDSIFEPFFTTKPVGKGTGLGLATVYGVVAQSGGHVTFDSAQGVGTTFRIFLPATTEPAHVDSGCDPAPAPEYGAGTILLAEDEPGVLRFVTRVLEKHGYTVLPTTGGADALALAAHYEQPIDLVLTDVVMPGMSGPAFVERLRSQRPDVRVLYVSGYTDDDVIRRGALQPGTTFLQKPFSVRGLVQAVHQVLGPGAQAAQSVDDESA